MLCTVQIGIMEARDLTAKDLNGYSDPYVKFRVKGQKYKSTIKKKTLNPRWNEKFIIKVELQPNKKSILTFEVWDADLLTPNEEIGAANVDLSTLLAPGMGSVESWFPVESGGRVAGQLNLQLSLIGGPPNNQRSAAVQSYTQPPMQPHVQPRPAPLQTPMGQMPMGQMPAYPSAQPYYTSAQPTSVQYPPPPAKKDKKSKKKKRKSSSSSSNSSSSSSGDDKHRNPESDPYEAFCYINAKVKNIPAPQIWEVLRKHNYNKAKALNALTTEVAPPVQQTTPFTAAQPQTAMAMPAAAPGQSSTYYYQQPQQPQQPQPTDATNYLYLVQQAPNIIPLVPQPVYGFHNASVYDPNVNAYSHGAGRRKAVIIGINYTGQKCALRGCIADVQKMRRLLTRTFGFTDDITSLICLTDDNPDPKFQPTRFNMIYAMKWLVENARPGDVLFFHFSGHGAQVPDKSGMEADGLDEVILPLDFKTAGSIVDDEMHTIMVQPLQSGVRLTAVMDCCHSGTGLDLPFFWNEKKNQWCEDDNPVYTSGDVQLFSGCADNQTAADVTKKGFCSQESGGAVTTAFVGALTSNPYGHTYPSLLRALRKSMSGSMLRQQPQLSTTQRFNFSRNFNLTDVSPNHNKVLGRQFRRKNKKKSSFKGISSKTVIAAGVGVALGSIFADLFTPDCYY